MPTSRFFINVIAALFSVVSYSQQTDSIAARAADTVPPKIQRYGVRVGVDLYKLTRSFYDKDYRGLELVGDYRLTKKYYIAAELGNENKTTDDARLNFTTKGTYIKVGFDYNTYENWLDMENMIYVGFRYGVSSFSQTLNSYEIYNRDQNFGPTQEIPAGTEYNGLTASWAELVVGMKAEVLPNFYAGFSFRLNRMITNKEPDNFANLYVPGFHRTYDGAFGVGLNYTVSYFIPIYKKTIAPKEKPAAK